MVFRVSVFSLLLALCSCATTYAPPVSGEAATLSIHNETGAIAYATAFKNAEDCSGGKQVIFPTGLPPFGGQSTTVPAGADFSFFVTTPDTYRAAGDGTTTASSCFVPVTFTPQVGATYRAIFRLSEDRSACQLKILIVNGALEQIDLSARTRIWQKPFSENGSFCRAAP